MIKNDDLPLPEEEMNALRALEKQIDEGLDKRGKFRVDIPQGSQAQQAHYTIRVWHTTFPKWTSARSSSTWRRESRSSHLIAL